MACWADCGNFRVVRLKRVKNWPKDAEGNPGGTGGRDFCWQPCQALLGHAYTHFKVRLHAFYCQLMCGEPAALEASEILWVGPGNLGDYPMGKIDRQISNMLSSTSTFPSYVGMLLFIEIPLTFRILKYGLQLLRLIQVQFAGRFCIINLSRWFIRAGNLWKIPRNTNPSVIKWCGIKLNAGELRISVYWLHCEQSPGIYLCRTNLHYGI